jgi:ATP-dependent Clp protease ATP-binding subunit ClpA
MNTPLWTKLRGREYGEGMLSRNLEKSLHRALAHANDRRHEYATLEHLLLALTEDQDAVAVLHACGVDLDWLRREVLTYVDNELGNLVAAHKDGTKPTASVQRVLQRAAIHVQSSGREEVTGALVAMFAEREGHAVYFLQEHDMTRFDAVNYVLHGIAKAPRSPATSEPDHWINAEQPGIPDKPDLTALEVSVLDLLRECKPNKVIAVQLNISEATVKVHVRNIMRKLRVSNRTHAALVANSLLAERLSSIVLRRSRLQKPG